MSSSDRDPLPVAVIGAGNMGSNHIRVYDELPEAELVEVVETNPETAASVQKEYNVRVLDDVGDIEYAQAVSIAVPNELHLPVARQCIAELELDILVEKPLASTVEAAQEIVKLADDYDAILQVGHIERYNPAIQVVEDILDSQDVIAIEAHRLGPFHEHLVDQSVVIDLMIHDIDVINSLVEAPVSRIDAVGAAKRSEDLDHAIANFQFQDGTLGTVVSSHVTHGKVRELDVTTQDAYISLNYQQQRVVIQQRGTEQMTVLNNKTGYRTETITETPFVSTCEPLKNELEDFVKCVHERSTPLVDGETGAQAVDIASRVLESIEG
ncbi:Gfo/Idh/MocA family protein [Halobellus captivus]|uniref:Gfo/Idh/MocA family protein n=1 Tax=Halobellus captivus TaxID=2592614 RepID=UPI00119D36DE|nr:Gfo/Idh/MocA family oxidoreductase [Halobellus captivus]